MALGQVLLAVSELEMHMGDRTLLNKVSLSVHENERIGIVGRNGAGKSTLLKILAGITVYDRGKIETRKGLKIAYIDQASGINDAATVEANIISSANSVEDLDSDSKALLNKLIKELRLPELSKIAGTLSGGEKRRVTFARALLTQPDLILFDEPTNHLDTQTIEWLEDYISNNRLSSVFVTHDRYFLDKIATRIIEVANGNLYSHEGNYTSYLVSKAERIAISERTETNRQRFLKKELEWVRRGPQGRTTKAKGRIDRYYEAASKDGPEKDLNINLVVPTPPKLSDRILDVKKAGLKIGDRWLFRNLDLSFTKGMKLGIVGRNGIGKTSLLKVITGAISPTEGTVDIASRTQINFIDQERKVVNEEASILQEVSEGTPQIRFGDMSMPATVYLKRFLFTDQRMRAQIKNLSGGERSRLLLAKILKNGGNFLILDEPTNDLDLSTLRILEEALSEFDGCAIIVSHDRFFLNRTCTHILGFEGDGETFLSAGDYDFYMKKRHDQLIDSAQHAQEDSKTEEKPKLSFAQLKEISKVESQIQKTEDEIKRLEEKFADPELYNKHPEKVSEFSARLQSLREKVNELYQKWEQMSSF